MTTDGFAVDASSPAVDVAAWVRRILPASADNVEDSRVELKAHLPDDYKSAKQIAALANAALRQPVLWIVGVDDKTGALVSDGIDPDLATWWAQVRRRFAGPPPSMRDEFVTILGGSVRALLFTSTRSWPHAVASPEGGRDTLVPWREGTTTRGATHDDLQTMIAHALGAGELSIDAGLLRIRGDAWHMSLYLDVRLPHGHVATFRHHDQHITLDIEGLDTWPGEYPEVRRVGTADSNDPVTYESDQVTVHRTVHVQLLARGPVPPVAHQLIDNITGRARIAVAQWPDPILKQHSVTAPGIYPNGHPTRPFRPNGVAAPCSTQAGRCRCSRERTRDGATPLGARRRHPAGSDHHPAWRPPSSEAGVTVGINSGTSAVESYKVH